MNLRRTSAAVIIAASLVTAFTVDDRWRPDWEILIGLFGWGIVAAVTAYKVRVWLRHGNDP